MTSKRTLETSSYDIPYSNTEIQGECILLAAQSLIYIPFKFYVFVILSVLTLGIPLLLIFWYPHLKKTFYYEYSIVDDASHIIIQNFDNSTKIIQKQTRILFDGNVQQNISYFVNRYLIYLIKNGQIVALQYDFADRLAEVMTGKATGWSSEDAYRLKQSYGPGAMVIQQPSAYQIFIKQVFRPLYIFLFINVVVQIINNYLYFCLIIMVSAISGIVMTIRQVMKVSQQIFEMAYYEIQLNVMRNGKITSISSLDIVPGDIVFFNSAIRMPFEAIILQGQLLMNQCVLTGESVPVVKKSESAQKYRNKDANLDKSSIIFQGTNIVQINSKKKMTVWESHRQQYGIPVCVTRTNFSTLKGQLIRKILYSMNSQNIFQKQSTKFLYALAIFTVLSYAALSLKLYGSIDTRTIIVRCFDIFSISVPPTLPISMTIGIIYAIAKLKKKDIFTISPNQIIDGGLLDTMCFDKTGTLTHDHMDFKSLVPCLSAKFQPIINAANYQKQTNNQQYLQLAWANMASNHTVIKLDNSAQLIGDPMEIKLLEFSSCKINTQSNDPTILFTFQSSSQKGEVYRRFDFDSDLQRMSVICRINTKNYHVFAKGSPQAMQKIMLKSSIPQNYMQKMKEFASSGFRILAIASKIIKKDYKTAERSDAQCDLQFNGFQIFQNGLKNQTRKAIQELRSINIHPIMITGDNPVTAANIGYQSAILHPHTKTLIIDYAQNQLNQQEFTFSSQGLAQLPFKNQPFRRKSKGNEPTNGNQNLQYINKALNKIKQNNFNICLTGSAFNYLFKEIDTQKGQTLHPFLIDLLEGTHILARTKPSDKAKVVKLHQQLNKIVGMCGDGANDCAALNQANLGLSLSDTQASIAAAFTAKQRHIGSMVQLIKQSRAGLATNFSLFNVMACYALTQYSSCFIQQFFYTYPVESHLIFWDLFLNFIFVFFLGNIATAVTLSRQKPSGSLFSYSNLFTLITYFIIQFLGQLLAILAIHGPFADQIDIYTTGGQQNNLMRYNEKGRGDFLFQSIENNVLFMVSNFFYLASVLSFTITKPWKQQFYTFIPLGASFVLLLAFCIFITQFPLAISIFDLRYMTSQKLNIFLLGIGLGVGLLIVFLIKGVLSPLFRSVGGKPEEEQLQKQ